MDFSCYLIYACVPGNVATAYRTGRVAAEVVELA